MRKPALALIFVSLLVCMTLTICLQAGEAAPAPASSAPSTSQAAGVAGSGSCRDCHAKFYELWSTSYHGLAMQPYTAELARSQLQPPRDEIIVGKYRYLADVGASAGSVRERGPEGEKRYPIAHVMGGKNVYYFLTPLDRGRLQVLPVAYDVRRKDWYDTAASAMRHFPQIPDQPLDWRDPFFTFNTSCYSCHVSQLSKNYDPATDTYHTVWAEPGINCETCHGSAVEHVRVFRQAPPGHPPSQLHLISTKPFTPAQKNAMCAPCHAKMSPITASFTPGDRYFDHFDLTGLENPDFYPDGRDLGENYTYTLWLTSPCVRRGQIDCLHCHTSSGRYRFKDADANNACMPCHEQRVRNADVHTRHKPDSPAGRCIACHMPMTEFARMRRTDHSMRPPAPAATIAFKSPNACNLCHADKDAAWADRLVRQWSSRDYQAQVVQRAGLVDAARKRDWSRLPDMLAVLAGTDRDEIYATSLVRLLRGCDDNRKWPVLIKLLSDPSPLVRSGVADALGGRLVPETVAALIGATRDDYRLVRVRAAAALAALPRESLGEQDRKSLEAATAEFEAAMHARPDDFASWYNLGNFHAERREFDKAIACYEKAVFYRPDHVAPLVNVSLIYNEMGRNDKAEESLRRALKIEPGSAAANLNLGLLLAEMGRPREAEDALRAAFKADPTLAVAAYNLGVLLAGDRLDEAIDWCRKAAELQGDEPKYAYTLAFFRHRKGDISGAVRVLQPLADKATPAADVYALLGQIYADHGQKDKAIGVYRQALANERLSDQDRSRFAAMIESLSTP